MDDRWQPAPVPRGDGRHDIGDDVRAAIFHRLHDDFTLAAPWMTAEQRRHVAMLAAASVRALLHELGTLRDMSDPSPAQPDDLLDGVIEDLESLKRRIDAKRTHRAGETMRIEFYECDDEIQAWLEHDVDYSGMCVGFGPTREAAAECGAEFLRRKADELLRATQEIPPPDREK